MTKLIAIHALHLAGAVKGTIDAIEPGHAFIARDEELYLNDQGATRPATSEDKGAKLAVRAGANAPEATAGKEDLGKLTKAQLIALAAAEEIAIDDKATNAVIIETIEAGRLAKDEDAI